MKAYKAEYGMLPDSAFAALGYDTVNLLANALTMAQSDNSDSIHLCSASNEELSGSDQKNRL